MWLTSSQADDSAVEELRHVLDDVAVGHRNAKDRRTRVGWSATKKRSLAFEDSNKPVILNLFYVEVCG